MDVIACFHSNCSKRRPNSEKSDEIVSTVYYIIKGPIVDG